MTRCVKVGSVAIGGGAPVSVQTMANIDPHDAQALIAQAVRCYEAGCDIYRLTVPDEEAAKVLGEVKRSSPLPLVADIHFDYRLALAAIEQGVDALRINPGNIGSRDRVQAVARRAKEKGIPIRIGVNLGSLEKDLAEGLSTRTPENIAHALVESARRHVALLEAEDFHDIVISAKASNVLGTLATYRLLHETFDYPLHLGVTEAGTLIPGTVRSSVAMGILLTEGIGDTIRVSLTDKPEREVKVGLEILRSLSLRPEGPAVTSCPTCGRTKVDLFTVASEVEEALERLYTEERRKGIERKRFPHVAVMGCVVNGPGEAKGADIALCGANGEFMLYVNGALAERLQERDATRKVVEYVVSLR